MEPQFENELPPIQRTDQLCSLITDCLTDRVEILSVSQDAKNRPVVRALLYNAFCIKCTLDPEESAFSIRVVLEDGSEVKSLLGKKRPVCANAQSILERLESTSEYCKARLPQKYLDAYGI